MEKREIQAIIFDMDGLLLDTERAVFEVWKQIAAEWGIPNMETMFPLCIGCNREGTEKIFHRFYGDTYDYAYFRELSSQRFVETYEAKGIPVKEGARELLQLFKDKGYPLALASSTRKETVLRQLAQVGLDHFFDVFATGDMVKNSKPDPEIFLLAKSLLEERFGVIGAENCVVFEDSFHGIRAAVAAGMRPIMVPDMLSPDEEMQEKAEVILESLLQVPGYLKL